MNYYPRLVWLNNIDLMIVCLASIYSKLEEQLKLKLKLLI